MTSFNPFSLGYHAHVKGDNIDVVIRDYQYTPGCDHYAAVVIDEAFHLFASPEQLVQLRDALNEYFERPLWNGQPYAQQAEVSQ